jgi:hypothetical protein
VGELETTTDQVSTCPVMMGSSASDLVTASVGLGQTTVVVELPLADEVALPPAAVAVLTTLKLNVGFAGEQAAATAVMVMAG